jgi:folate-binding protein YgfZ
LATPLPRTLPRSNSQRMKAAMLPGRAVIALFGGGVREFLQGLVTNDVEDCAPRRALYAGLLTPQGKLLFDFLLADAGDGRILIDCAADRAADLIKRLGFYRLRAKVAISPAPELSVAAFWDGDMPEIGTAPVFPDPRLPRLGFRAIGAAAELARAVAAQEPGDYDVHRLSLGVPDSADIGSDRIFALDAGFEELHGVSFRKGCYVGQEVTARMKHRALARRRFFVVEADRAVPAPGTAIEAQAREAGTMATGKNGLGLALMRLDRAAEAEDAKVPFTAAGLPLRLTKPDWLRT